MEETKRPKELKIKENEKQSIEVEVKEVMNTIKDSQIKNGMIPSTPPIEVYNFAGKILKIDKSVLWNDKQYFVKKGTAWEDVDAFFRRHISFSTKDFE